MTHGTIGLVPFHHTVHLPTKRTRWFELHGLINAVFAEFVFADIKDFQVCLSVEILHANRASLLFLIIILSVIFFLDLESSPIIIIYIAIT